MEDGASAHRAKAKQVVRDEYGMESLIWVPSSPDLNPIEAIWRKLKAWLNRAGRATTAEERVFVVRFRKSGLNLPRALARFRNLQRKTTSGSGNKNYQVLGSILHSNLAIPDCINLRKPVCPEAKRRGYVLYVGLGTKVTEKGLAPSPKQEIKLPN